MLFFVFNVQANDHTKNPFVSEIKEAEQSVFLILVNGNEAQGTGFPVVDSGKTYITTNFHVIMGANSEQDISIENEHWGRLNTKKTIAAYSASDDLALIEIDGYSGSVFKLADFNNANDSSGYLMGFPGSKFQTTEVWGIHSRREARPFKISGDCNDKNKDPLGLTDITVPVPEMRALQGEKADATSLLGNSGGPLLNQNKEVIGMLHNGDCQELYFIDSRLVKSLLYQSGLKFEGGFEEIPAPRLRGDKLRGNNGDNEPLAKPSKLKPDWYKNCKSRYVGNWGQDTKKNPNKKFVKLFEKSAQRN